MFKILRFLMPLVYNLKCITFMLFLLNPRLVAFIVIIFIGNFPDFIYYKRDGTKTWIFVKWLFFIVEASEGRIYFTKLGLNIYLQDFVKYTLLLSSTRSVFFSLKANRFCTFQCFIVWICEQIYFSNTLVKQIIHT